MLHWRGIEILAEPLAIMEAAHMKCGGITADYRGQNDFIVTMLQGGMRDIPGAGKLAKAYYRHLCETDGVTPRVP